MTIKEQVHALLRPRRWITGAEIESQAGEGALRRLRELRDEYEIKSRRIAGTSGFEYRLVGRR